MSDRSYTPAELESLALKCEEHAEFLRRTEQRLTFDWPARLSVVCRQALAQAEEIERLRPWQELWSRVFEAISLRPLPDDGGTAGHSVELLLDWIDRAKAAEAEVERLQARVRCLENHVCP